MCCTSGHWPAQISTVLDRRTLCPGFFSFLRHVALVTSPASMTTRGCLVASRTISLRGIVLVFVVSGFISTRTHLSSWHFAWRDPILPLRLIHMGSCRLLGAHSCLIPAAFPIYCPLVMPRIGSSQNEVVVRGSSMPYHLVEIRRTEVEHGRQILPSNHIAASLPPRSNILHFQPLNRTEMTHVLY